MAQWKTYTIKDIIVEIEYGNFVLPIIQRELVWDKDKIIHWCPIKVFEKVEKK